MSATVKAFVQTYRSREFRAASATQMPRGIIGRANPGQLGIKRQAAARPEYGKGARRPTE